MKSLIQMRNEDFCRRCRRIFEADISKGAHPSLDELVKRSLAQAPMSHYINYDTASNRLTQIEKRGVEAVFKEEEARQMWRELHGQVKETMALRGCSREKALSFVLNFRHPSRFYISMDTARRLLAPYVSYTLVFRS